MLDKLRAVIKYIVPYEENSMMVGFDLLSSENRHEYVYRAMDINNAVAQGPILTNQGKLHVINRIPIYLMNNGRETFWGIVSISIDFEKFMEKHNISTRSEHFDYVIYTQSVDGYSDFYWGNREIFDKSYIIETINLPELTWEMASYPRNGWYQYLHLDLPYLLIGIILSIFTYLQINHIAIKYDNAKKWAKTDALTGCNNRLDFESLFESNVNLKEDSALMILDIDDFKSLNDSYGHHTGDLVLKEITSVIKSCIRESDQVYRIGGDEFVIILNNLNSASEISHISQRLIDSVENDFDAGDVKINVSISIGIYYCKDGMTATEEAYKMADINLYRAKEKGKNCFV